MEQQLEQIQTLWDSDIAVPFLLDCNSHLPLIRAGVIEEC